MSQVIQPDSNTRGEKRRNREKGFKLRAEGK